MKPNAYVTFTTPQHIQRLCDALPYTYAEICELLGCSLRTLRYYRSGEFRAPYHFVYALEQLEEAEGIRDAGPRLRPGRSITVKS